MYSWDISTFASEKNGGSQRCFWITALGKILTQYLNGSSFKSLLGVLKERMQVPLFMEIQTVDPKQIPASCWGPQGVNPSKHQNFSQIPRAHFSHTVSLNDLL